LERTKELQRYEKTHFNYHRGSGFGFGRMQPWWNERSVRDEQWQCKRQQQFRGWQFNHYELQLESVRI